MECIHSRRDMCRKVSPQKLSSLRTVEGHELQGDGQALFQPKLATEQRLDSIVEIQAARLKFGAQRVVYA